MGPRAAVAQKWNRGASVLNHGSRDTSVQKGFPFVMQPYQPLLISFFKAEPATLTLQPVVAAR
jgi:hypothetical protein